MKEKRRMISEAARQLGLETYHLRTWEEEFSLTIPRNEKGYRCYGDKEIHTFEQIRDMRNAGLDSEEIKQKLSGNIIPFPEEKQTSILGSRLESTEIFGVGTLSEEYTV